MRRYGFRTRVHRFAFKLALWLGIAAAVVAATGKVDVNAIPPSFAPLKPSIIRVQSWIWWLSPLLILLAGVFTWIRKQIGEPWVWGAIHHLMNTYRDFVFSEEKQETKHHHRVTLFRHCPWYHPYCLRRLPWGARLVPVARSGHTTQKTDTTFRAPDNADKAEGFAGKAWAKFATIIIDNLPDLEADQSDEAIREYAKKAFFSEEWVRRRIAEGRVNARSFCGIPIRVNGIEWGVIVIDSRSPVAVKRVAEGQYEVMGKVLSKLLERV
jgi:hypothetical protein